MRCLPVWRPGWWTSLPDTGEGCWHARITHTHAHTTHAHTHTLAALMTYGRVKNKGSIGVHKNKLPSVCRTYTCSYTYQYLIVTGVCMCLSVCLSVTDVMHFPSVAISVRVLWALEWRCHTSALLLQRSMNTNKQLPRGLAVWFCALTSGEGSGDWLRGFSLTLQVSQAQ